MLSSEAALARCIEVGGLATHRNMSGIEQEKGITFKEPQERCDHGIRSLPALFPGTCGRHDDGLTDWAGAARAPPIRQGGSWRAAVGQWLSRSSRWQPMTPTSSER